MEKGKLYIGENKMIVMCTSNSDEGPEGEFEGVTLFAPPDEYGKKGKIAWYIEDYFELYDSEITIKN